MRTIDIVLSDGTGHSGVSTEFTVPVICVIVGGSGFFDIDLFLCAQHAEFEIVFIFDIDVGGI